MSHTLIYIPSYFDYIRLRNYMKKEEINFASICEYSSKSEVSRARHFFQKGDKQFLLFTERFHFYKRSVLLNSLSGSSTCVGLCVWFEGDFVFSPSAGECRVSQIDRKIESSPLTGSSRVFLLKANGYSKLTSLTTGPSMKEKNRLWWAFWWYWFLESLSRHQ